MNAAEIIDQIKLNEKYWGGEAITPQQIEALAHLSAAGYTEVVSTLLLEPVAAHRDLRAEAYRKTYAHLVYGALFFCLRPDPDLYNLLLTGVLGIADPSSIQYGAVALQQVRPVEQIVSDLFVIAGQNPENLELLSHIAWLFYWLGFSEDGGWWERIINIGPDGDWIKLYKENTKPETDPRETARAAQNVAKFMDAYYQVAY